MRLATIFEEHSSVLAHWFEAGVSNATLVCLDAHLDLQFIEPSRIERLRRCTSTEELRRLESRHPLSPDRSSCYGIEDFLFPAARLGLIARLIWVAPAHVAQGGLRAALSALQQMEGVALADLESFRRTPGGWIEGRLLGLDLAICNLAQLPQLTLKGPLLADIDTDYFVRVPEDLVWTEPSAVVAALQALPAIPAELTISRSVGSGFLPLQHRFLADHLAALWEHRPVDVDHWQQLLDQEHHQRTGRREEAIAGLNLNLARRPDCAATCYALGLASADNQARKRHFAQAAALAPAYADDLLRRLGEFRARWKGLDLATVLALQREVATLVDSPERQATAWVALGGLYSAFGRLEEALDCDAKSLRSGAGHPELALEIAKLHMARGEVDPAISLLERAADDDETRVAAWVDLAECAFAKGDYADAIRLGQLAHRAAPAWPAVLKRLAVFARALGNDREAKRHLAHHYELTQRINDLLARLM